jgi:hypothetical protein
MGLLVLGAGNAPTALAAPPTITTLHLEREALATGVTNLCGFTVMRADDMYFRIITYYDGQGNVTKELDLVHGTATFSANGQSITGIYRGFDRFTFEEDGSMTWLGVAPSLLVVLPGVGPVWGATGNFRILFDPEGNIVSVQEAGPGFADPAMCTALAP